MKSGFDFMAAVNNPPAEASIPPPAVIGINDSDRRVACCGGCICLKSSG